MFRVMRVTGESLSPDYNEGDFVVLTTIPFFLNRIRVGDIIVFRNPSYGILIKMVERVLLDENAYDVRGSHPSSVDSRIFGPVSKSSIIGRLIWHIPRRA